ncbi:MAG: Gfo/Idh/MocA family oxidoreductase [Nocardioidaceae bacterium]
MTSAPIVAFVGAGNVPPATTSVPFIDSKKRGWRWLVRCWPVARNGPAELGRHGFPDLSIVAGFADLLAQPVDVAVVLTPPAAHPDHVRACLDAGFHVLGEETSRQRRRDGPTTVRDGRWSRAAPRDRAVLPVVPCFPRTLQRSTSKP